MRLLSWRGGRCCGPTHALALLVRRVATGQRVCSPSEEASVVASTPEELVIATKHDSEALEKLVTLDTQLCTSKRLLPSLLVRLMLWSVLSFLSARHGRRLMRSVRMGA